MTLSELWDETEPRPLWQRTLELLPRDRFDRAACLIASSYVVLTIVLLFVTVRP